MKSTGRNTWYIACRGKARAPWEGSCPSPGRETWVGSNGWAHSCPKLPWRLCQCWPLLGNASASGSLAMAQSRLWPQGHMCDFLHFIENDWESLSHLYLHNHIWMALFQLLMAICERDRKNNKLLPPNFIFLYLFQCFPSLLYIESSYQSVQQIVTLTMDPDMLFWASGFPILFYVGAVEILRTSEVLRTPGWRDFQVSLCISRKLGP